MDPLLSVCHTAVDGFIPDFRGFQLVLGRIFKINLSV